MPRGTASERHAFVIPLSLEGRCIPLPLLTRRHAHHRRHAAALARRGRQMWEPRRGRRRRRVTPRRLALKETSAQRCSATVRAGAVWSYVRRMQAGFARRLPISLGVAAVGGESCGRQITPRHAATALPPPATVRDATLLGRRGDATPRRRHVEAACHRHPTPRLRPVTGVVREEMWEMLTGGGGEGEAW